MLKKKSYHFPSSRPSILRISASLTTSAPVTFIELTVGRCRGMRRGSKDPAEAHVVEEFQAIAVVALANGAALEPARDAVLGDPNLIVALSKARGVDKSHVVRHFLPDR